MVLRIFKMIATSGFLAALECPKWNKFVFVPGKKEGERKGRKGEGQPPLTQIPGSAPAESVFY